MGSGFRTFTAGEVLTASNVQNYLMDQSVMVFGGSAARSSAIGTANFEEGMVSYLTDTDKVEAYNGTNWVSVAPTTTQGLTLINTTSFSGVAAASLPASTFTTAYTNYRILVDLTSATADNTVNLRLRSGGSDIATGTIYVYALNGHNSAGGNDPTASTGANQLFIAEMDTGSASEYTASIIELFNPMTASKRKIGFVQSYYTNQAASAFISRTGGCFFNTTTACDSLSLIPTAGNFTGVIRVYGYNV